MKYLTYFILITICIANAVGSTAIGNFYSTDNPGKCTFSKQLIISPGENVDYPEMCAKISCEDTKGNVLITGCGAVGTPSNCEWGEPIDKDASYPDCCEKHLYCYEDTIL